jgi:hypothetical protein
MGKQGKKSHAVQNDKNVYVMAMMSDQCETCLFFQSIKSHAVQNDKNVYVMAMMMINVKLAYSCKA